MSLEIIRKEHNLPINYNSIEETENSWIILKNTHLPAMLTFPFKNINIMFGLDKDNFFKIHSLHYPKNFFGKENVLKIAQDTMECPYCIIGKKAVIGKQLEEIYLNTKYIDKNIVIENMTEKNYENNGNEKKMVETPTDIVIKETASKVFGLNQFGVSDWVWSVLINEGWSALGAYVAKSRVTLGTAKFLGGLGWLSINPVLAWIFKGDYTKEELRPLRTQFAMLGFNQLVGGIGEWITSAVKYGDDPIAEAFEAGKAALEGIMSGYGPAEILGQFVRPELLGGIGNFANGGSVGGYEDTEEIKIGFSDPIVDERYDGLKIMH